MERERERERKREMSRGKVNKKLKREEWREGEDRNAHM